MNTLVLSEPGRFFYEDRPAVKAPGAGEARVRVRRIGVCGTDLHAFKGGQPFFVYPRVLGHELGVEVIESAEETENIKTGDLCAVEPYLNCGACRPCALGKTNCCEKLSVLGVHEDGGMTEELVLPAVKLHKSTRLPLEHLALVEMLTIGAHAVRRAEVSSQDRVLVVGAGPIGLGVVRFSQLAGANPVVFEMDARRRAFCENSLGVSNCLMPDEDPQAQLRALMDGSLPDIVFDATGSSNSMHRAFGLTGAGGKLVFVGLILGDVSFYDPDFHRKELTLMSSRNGTAADFQRVINKLESGNIDLEPWITHRATFGKTAATFARWLDREEGVVKAMIDVD